MFQITASEFWFWQGGASHPVTLFVTAVQDDESSIKSPLIRLEYLKLHVFVFERAVWFCVRVRDLNTAGGVVGVIIFRSQHGPS